MVANTSDVVPAPSQGSDRLERLRAQLATPVSIQSLVAFRFVFGALLVWDTWRFVSADRIRRYFVEPDFTFTYPGFGWVQPLPEPWIHVAWSLIGITSFLVMLGLFYRVAIITFTVLFTYFFLLDKAQYLNHFYMVIIFAMLMCFMPANRAFSIDALIWPRLRTMTIPYVAVFVLRAQIEIILLFAGLVKLTEDWIKGEPLGLWLRAQADSVPMGALFTFDWFIIAGAWGTILLHVIGAPLLLWERTRLPVFAIYCIFHMSNAYLFNIGIFPWLTIGATLVVFSPDWPQRAARWFAGRFEVLPPMSSVPRAAPVRLLAMPVLVGLGLWIALQVAVPLRHVAFPSEVRWTGDGHRFAWRMRMYDRDARGYFLISTPDGRAWVAEPRDFLSDRQSRTMLTRPDMIWQFANYLESVWSKEGYGDVAVHAHIEKSLNGRAFQPYIDPAVDLISAKWNIFGPDAWVLPLSTRFEDRAQ